MPNNNYDIKIAPIKDSLELKNAIAAELAKTGVKLDSLDDFSSLAELEVSTVVEPITKLVFAVDSSPRVHDAVFACLARCTYDGERITLATFENAEMREHYYPIILECVKVNLAPFFASLVSKLKASNINMGEILK